MKSTGTISEKESFERNAYIYRVLSNPKRLEIINFLHKKREATVMEISKASGIRMTTVSQHLRILRMGRLLKLRREGQNSYYSLRTPRIAELRDILMAIWPELQKA